jgi:hypothetical protein
LQVRHDAVLVSYPHHHCSWKSPWRRHIPWQSYDIIIDESVFRVLP